MKIARYLDKDGEVGFCEWRGSSLPPLKIVGNFGNFEVTGDIAEIEHLLSPIDPRAIYGVGLNYRAHAEETGKSVPKIPLIFMKAPSAVQNPGKPILVPRGLRSDKVDYEGELAVVIGRAAKNVNKSEALSYVLGYTVANDVSARDWQFEWGNGQFCRGKTFDTFCPLGPCLVTTDEIKDPSDLRLKTCLNGETVQETSTRDMIFDIPSIISFLSGSTTLVPGTVILTGTPSGVGAGKEPPRYLKPGDEVEIEIEGIGSLSNPIEYETL
ncbi:MAG: fumarylacetoacetate hydrolase family protein [Verrucomicrobiota bacterium]